MLLMMTVTTRRLPPFDFIALRFIYFLLWKEKQKRYAITNEEAFPIRGFDNVERADWPKIYAQRKN